MSEPAEIVGDHAQPVAVAVEGAGVDPGAEWSPDAAGQSDPVEHEPVAPVTPEQVQEFLSMLTGGLNAAVGERVGADLAMNTAELQLIAPPLTKYVNRVPVVARIVGHSDTLQLAAGVAMYGARIVAERRASVAATADPWDGADQLAPDPDERAGGDEYGGAF